MTIEWDRDGWARCEACGGRVADVRVFWRVSDGEEVACHPRPYRAPRKMFMCVSILEWSPKYRSKNYSC